MHCVPHRSKYESKHIKMRGVGFVHIKVVQEQNIPAISQSHIYVCRSSVTLLIIVAMLWPF